jgi:hypothetical protein
VKLSSDTNEALLWASGAWATLSVTAGIIVGFEQSKGEVTCEANSIQELLNVPYRVACELTRRRWE